MNTHCTCSVCAGKGWYADGPTDKPEQVQCSACQGSGKRCLHARWEGIPEVNACCADCGMDEVDAGTEILARCLMLTEDEQKELRERMQRVVDGGNDGADIYDYEDYAKHLVSLHGEEAVKQFENELCDIQPTKRSSTQPSMN